MKLFPKVSTLQHCDNSKSPQHLGPHHLLLGLHGCLARINLGSYSEFHILSIWDSIVIDSI